MQFIFLSFTLTKLLPIFTGQCTIKWPDHCKQKNEIDKLSSNWLVPCQLSYDYYSKHCKTIPHHPPTHLDIDAAILVGFTGQGGSLGSFGETLGNFMYHGSNGSSEQKCVKPNLPNQFWKTKSTEPNLPNQIDQSMYTEQIK